MNGEQELEFERMLLVDQGEGKAGPMGSSSRRYEEELANTEDATAAATKQLDTERRGERVHLLSTSEVRGLSWRPAPPGRAAMELTTPSRHCPFWTCTAYLLLFWPMLARQGGPFA